MESPVAQPNFHEKKKMAKQLTGKRDDTPLHAAARAGKLDLAKEILSEVKDEGLSETLSKQNQAGETALYVATEYGHLDVVKGMLDYYNLATASIKAKNGYDALHIAARQGNLVLKELLKALPELAMTVDISNTTALYTAAAKGHLEAVSLLIEVDGSLLKIARSNGKTALHSAARNGHLEVVKVILDKEPGLATKNDNKGQIALHMAVKGQNLELVEALLKCEPSLVNMMDSKGNTALHIATRKGRSQVRRTQEPVTAAMKYYIDGDEWRKEVLVMCYSPAQCSTASVSRVGDALRMQHLLVRSFCCSPPDGSGASVVKASVAALTTTWVYSQALM